MWGGNSVITNDRSLKLNSTRLSGISGLLVVNMRAISSCKSCNAMSQANKLMGNVMLSLLKGFELHLTQGNRYLCLLLDKSAEALYKIYIWGLNLKFHVGPRVFFHPYLLPHLFLSLSTPPPPAQKPASALYIDPPGWSTALQNVIFRQVVSKCMSWNFQTWIAVFWQKKACQ